MNTDKIIVLTQPCPEGAAYLRRYKTLQDAWKHCQRGDWMLWLAQKLNVNVRVLMLAKGLCANTARHLMQDERSVAAIDAAIAFGRGGIGKKELAAAYAAYAAYAADAAYADDADDAYAYDAYAYAAYADDAYAYAAYAADAAAYAAYAADAADAAYAAYAAAKKENRKKTSNICREVLTEAVMQAALETAERGEE